jgi:deleted-in-malignant-brain-tumors protein 1
MWGTVCDDDWDAVDARVACMQLGYSPTNAIAYREARFGQGVVPIVLDNVACQGSETRLIDCSYDGHTADCRHAEDAGIQCQCKTIDAYHSPDHPPVMLISVLSF